MLKLVDVPEDLVNQVYRQHSHCPKCWSEQYIEVNGTQRCYQCDEQPQMLVCTPTICASS